LLGGKTPRRNVLKEKKAEDEAAGRKKAEEEYPKRKKAEDKAAERKKEY
jgi:hypothetical protein